MKTLRFENLIDSNTGKTVEIEVPDDFDETDPMYVAAGERGRAFAERISAVVDDHDLRQVHSLIEIGEIGSESAQKLLKMFKNHGFGSKTVVVQEWFETPRTKTGWDTVGWMYENGMEISLNDSCKDVVHTEADKYGHPTKGYLIEDNE